MSLLPLREEGIEIEWKGWKMPEGVTPPPPKPNDYGQKAQIAMVELLKARGLSTERPAFRPNTRLAHIGTRYARETGRQTEFVAQVFHHHWALGEDISKPEVLLRAAIAAGLNADQFEKALTDAHWGEEVEKDYGLAKDLQITTIPSYMGEQGIFQVHHFEDMPNLKQIKDLL